MANMLMNVCGSKLVEGFNCCNDRTGTMKGRGFELRNGMVEMSIKALGKYVVSIIILYT